METKLKTYFKNIIAIFFILVFTFKYSFDWKDISELPKIVMNVHIQYIIIAIFAMCLVFVCQSIAVKKLLYSFGYHATISQCFRYSLIDYYFSSITPGASGGQPSEIYYMKKDGIDISESSLVMLIYNSLYHVAVIFVIFASTLGNIKYILGGNYILLILFRIGIVIQLFLAIMFFVLIFSKKFIYKLLDKILSVLKYFRYPKMEELEENIKVSLEAYQKGAEWISKDYRIFLKIMPVLLLQLSLFYSISYWIGKAFGIENISLLKMIAYQGVFTMTFESLPLPGGVGIAESGFLRIFSKIYSSEKLSAALLLNRGITYYVYVLFGGAISFFSKGQKVRKFVKTA